MKRLYALRGATQCQNTIADMCEQVAALYDELLSKNSLEEKDIVSLIFSVTADLYAVNPCTALRHTGRGGEVALFSAQEPEYSNSLEQTVRALVHCYLEEGTAVKYVYRNGAEVLRPDRVGRAIQQP
jgi:chorismate mutase